MEKLNIVISGSRHSNERELIIDTLKSKFTNLNIYDCNKTVTDLIAKDSELEKWDPLLQEDQTYPFSQEQIKEVTAKQKEINSKITKCDWFILVAPTNFYGKWTFMEWQIMLNTVKRKKREQVFSVFRCSNWEESVKGQNITDVGDYSFSDFENLQKSILQTDNYLNSYTFDAGGMNTKDKLSRLKNELEKEIDTLKIQNLAMRMISIPRKELKASHIFKNRYRTKPERGFDDNFYLRRSSVDEAMETKTQKTVTMILGAPASGKTRAVYEFLKKSPKLSDNVRIIKLNRRNIAAIHNHLENYSQWHDLLGDNARRTENLSDYYFVCDQIFDEIYTPNDNEVSLWWKIYDLAVDKFGASILATSLVEEYETNKERLFANKNISYEEIFIKNISEDPDFDFRSQLEEYYKRNGGSFNGDISKMQVIGDYIKGLVDYHDTVFRAIEDYDNQHGNFIGNFAKSYNTIRLYRHIGNIPLGLVLAVFNKMSSDSITKESYLDFERFCKRNNILKIKKQEGQYGRFNISDNTVYTYDNERVKIPVSPNFLIEICNDYVWNAIKEKYRFSLENVESMKECMESFCDAFFSETPVNTLKRIISRSPSVRFSIDYQGYENFVREHVCNEVYSLCHNEYDIKYDKKEMNELIAYILHRSNSIEEFKNDFEEFTGWVGEDFELTEEVIGELMGFGMRRTRKIKAQTLAFLKDKGWDFDIPRTTIYYHRRMIEYMDSFNEISDYMANVVLKPEVLNNQTDAPDLLLLNKRSLYLSVLDRAKCHDDLLQIIEWIKVLNCPINRKMIVSMKARINDQEFEKNDALNQILLSRMKHIFYADDGLCMIADNLKDYYLILLASCFQNAAIHFKESEEFNNNPPLRNRAISEMIKLVKGSEFSFLYRFCMQENILDRMAQVSRNLLIKSLNVGDAINFAEVMFNGDSLDSIADRYTMISLLSCNYEFFKSKHHNNSSNLAFQNVLQILRLPMFQNITYDVTTIAMMLQICSTDEQENYLTTNFIKPSIRAEILLDEDLEREEEITSKVNRKWDELKTRPEIVISRINNSYKTEIHEIYEYVKKTMNKMLEDGIVQNPNILNILLNKLYHCHKNGHIKAREANQFRNRLKVYLESPLSDRQRIDFFYKDEYFYRAYFRIYPDKAIARNAEGKYSLSSIFNQIPVKFVDHVLFQHMIEGIEAWKTDESHKIKEDLADIIEYISENQNNSKKNSKFKKQSQKYYHSEKWDFLSDFSKGSQCRPESDEEDMISKIQELKQEDKDSLPSPSLMHQVLKNKRLKSDTVFSLLKHLYLEHDLVITSSLWKSALEGLHNKEDYASIYEGIKDLKNQYGHLILDDTCSLLYQVLLKPDSPEKRKEFKVICDDLHFRSLQEYGVMINSYDLYDELEDYVHTMTEYEEMNNLVCTKEPWRIIINNTHSHFLIGCTKLYSPNTSTSYKESILDILSNFHRFGKHDVKAYLSKTVKKLELDDKYNEMARDVGYNPGDKR